MKALSKQNVIDILYGCTVLGTGGGGNLERGLALVNEDMAQGKTLKLADLAELPDESFIATPYGCGAPTKVGADEDPAFKDLPHAKDSAAAIAFKSLEEYMGAKFFAVSSTELGGENTAEALHTAFELGLPIMDADPAGRSVPELQHSTYYVKNIPIDPMAVATNFGEEIILKKVCGDLRAEEIVRSIAVVSGNEVGVADHPMTGKAYKQSIIPGAISYAMKIGELLRTSVEQGFDGYSVAKAIAENMAGKLAFKGKLTDAPWETRDGFNYGEIHLDGLDDFENEKYRIWFKNENIMAYRNEVIDATVPDLICMIDKKGVPITTPNFTKGMEINVLLLPSPDIWRTPEGVDCLGPKHFGFDIEYVPYSKLGV